MAVGRMIYIKYSKNIIYRLNRVKLCFILFCCIFLAFSTGMCYTLATIYGVYHQVNITILTADMIVSLIGLLSYLCLYRKVISHVKNSSKIVRCKSAMHQQKYKQIYSDAVSMTKTINQIIIVLCISYFPYITIGLVYSSQPHICNKRYANVMSNFVMVTYLLIYVTPSMNAAIFLAGNRKCRKFTLELFQ